MTGEGIDLALRIASILATVGATIVALTIAVRGRQAAARQARLLFELDTATRLIEALTPRGGFAARAWDKDDDGRQARITSLTAALGEARVPHLWHQTFKDRPTPPGSTWKVSMDDIFVRPGAALDEVQTALEAIAAELQRSGGGRQRRARRNRERPRPSAAPAGASERTAPPQG